MTKVVDAIYTHGVLEPLERLDLHEKQRVRLTIEALDGAPAPDRGAAFARFLKGVRDMTFRSTEPYPSRNELHDRS